MTKKLLKYLAVFILFVLLGTIALINRSYFLDENKRAEVKRFGDLNIKAISLRQNGKIDEAIAHLEEAVLLHDQHADTFIALAELYRVKKRYAISSIFFTKAYGINQDDFKSLYQAALSDYAANLHKESIIKLERLLHHDRKRGKYFRLLAKNHQMLKQDKEALSYYALLVELGRFTDDPLLKELKALYDKADPKPKAKDITFEYEKLTEIEALSTLMDKYLKEDFDMKALKTGMKIHLEDANHQKTHTRLAKLYYKHNITNKAYSHAQKIKEKDAKVLEIEGAILQMSKRYSEALTAYEKSYKKEPKTELLRAMYVSAIKDKNSTKKVAKFKTLLKEKNPYLLHKVDYALETDSGIEHSTLDSWKYILLNHYYEFICYFRDCG